MSVLKMTKPQLEYVVRNNPITPSALKSLLKDDAEQYVEYQTRAIAGLIEEREAFDREEEAKEEAESLADTKYAVYLLPDFADEFDVEAQEKWISYINVDPEDVTRYLMQHKKAHYDRKPMIKVIRAIQKIVIKPKNSDAYSVLQGSEKYNELVNDAQHTIQTSSKSKHIARAKDMLSVLGVEPEIDPFADVKPREFIVGNKFPVETIGEIHGKSGHLKTTFMLDLLFCVAHGIEFHGEPVKQGRVIYVTGEDYEGVKIRVAALAAEYGVDKVDRDMFKLIPIGEVKLLDEKSMKAFSAKLKSWGQSQMIFMDTLRKVAGKGFNIVNGTGWGDITQNIEEYIQPYVSNVSWTAHPTKTKDKDIGGHGDRYNDSDFFYFVTRKNEAMFITLRSEKNKGGLNFKDMKYYFKINDEFETVVSKSAPAKVDGKLKEVQDLLITGIDLKDAVIKVFYPDGAKDGTIRQRVNRVKKELEEL